ncbi:MAG: aminoglycoside phosphotransferase family protein [Clostridia bacterium]|nr:aminoglycoside phosphotransferase family protein [Clostridia bacterium]
MVKDKIKSIVEKHMKTTVKDIREVGKGASGNVFYVKISDKPYELAVKTSKFYDNICKEKKMLEFLQSKASYKVPETYFLLRDNDIVFFGMEYIKGMSGKSKYIKFVPSKKHLRNSILSAFINTQNVHNDKFGKFDAPAFNNWADYYKDFFSGIYEFTKEKYERKEIEPVIMKAVELINRNLDEILKSTENTACLCHGDFWMPNLIIDFRKSELAGVVDPFDMLWAEPEYELFCLTLGFGEKLELYEEYKKRKQTSKYCDLKVELYALCNELNWYILLGEMEHGYLLFRSERLIKRMTESGLN